MIQMDYRDGNYRPRFVCDVCEQPITDARMAIALTPLAHNEPVDVVDVRHVHKGTCDAAVTELCGDGGWEELRDHILFLAANAGLSPDDLRQRRVDLQDLYDAGLYE